jgi:hypothetical protein
LAIHMAGFFSTLLVLILIYHAYIKFNRATTERTNTL